MSRNVDKPRVTNLQRLASASRGVAWVLQTTAIGGVAVGGAIGAIWGVTWAINNLPPMTWWFVGALVLSFFVGLWLRYGGDNDF